MLERDPSAFVALSLSTSISSAPFVSCLLLLFSSSPAFFAKLGDGDGVDPVDGDEAALEAFAEIASEVSKE